MRVIAAIVGLALAGLAVSLTPAPAAAQLAARQKVEAQFVAWREGLWAEAKAAGISRQTFEAGLAGVVLDWSLPDLVPPGEGAVRDHEPVRQREFGSPGQYFAEAGLDFLVARGRAMRDKWRPALAAIESRYGVPHQILLAIWGRETGYGSVNIPHDAVQALATQAFMGRRQAFFRQELLAALKLLEAGHVSRRDLRSSWAGAMGHTQMLPSRVLRYGVDFDGDGRRDVWNSPADALATTANFLVSNGWRANLPWGYEVERPEAADCTLEGPHQGRPFAEWVAMGYTRTRGRVFPPFRLKDKGHLLQPAGRHGPSFLVTDNFYVLKAYNESDLYALYIGHLGDRLADNRSFATAWKDVPTYTRSSVKALQQVLAAQGYHVGETIDGLIGFRTRIAVGHYQRKRGLAVDCWPGPETMTTARQDG